MVLFKDDEERMKKQEREEKLRSRSALGKWVRRILKVFFVLSLLFIAGIWLLSSLSGSHDALKKGVEDYLAQETGLWTQIGQLNDMGFFPDFKVNAEDIVFRREPDGPVVMNIRAARFRAGFLDMMLSRRHFRVIELEDLRAGPEVTGGPVLVLNEVVLKDEAADGKPAIVARGHYGERDIDIFVLMEKVYDGKLSYRLPQKSDIRISYGDMALTGTAGKADGGGLKLEIASLGFPGKVAEGTIVLKRRFTGITAEVDFELGQSRLETDLRLAGGNIEGTIVFPVLHLADLEIVRIFYDHLSHLPGSQQKNGIGLQGLAADVSLVVEQLHGPQATLGNFTVTAKLEEQILSATLSGTLGGGDLSGHVSLDATATPAAFAWDATLRSWDYGHYQKALFGREKVSGQADLVIALTGKGNNYEEILSALSGEIVFMAGEAHLESRALDVWGQGLMNLMIADLSESDRTELNCMIADFEVESGIAKPSPLFIDTDRLKIIGEGEINLADNRIDLTLEPRSKDPVLFEVSSAVELTGPILNPEMSRTSFSLFETLGGLALGAINPALTVLTLSDLGLTENHPCYRFIEKPGEEKDAEQP